MLRHPPFQPSQSFWAAATLLSASALLLSITPRLRAQTSPASSSLANTQPPPSAPCSDLLSTPCSPPPASPTASLHPDVETSLSLGAFAQLTPTRLQDNTYNGRLLSTQTQGIAPTAGVLGTFRQQFRPWLGYSVNMGYTRVDERYTYPITTPGGSDLHIPSNLYEISFSYVVEKHLTPRLTGFADAGGGAVVALPINRSGTPISPQLVYIHPPVNFRPEGVTGFGLDLRLTQNLDFGAEYRGLLYKNPDFGGQQKSTTWSSEPTLSLVFRFGKGSRTHIVAAPHP